MTVSRCQAVLADGSQCVHQTKGGQSFCWRHSDAVRAVNESVKEAGKGGKQALKSVRSWSTNAWESTKSGWNRAVDTTRERLDEVRVGTVELLGGKDAPKEKK